MINLAAAPSLSAVSLQKGFTPNEPGPLRAACFRCDRPDSAAGYWSLPGRCAWRSRRTGTRDRANLPRHRFPGDRQPRHRATPDRRHLCRRGHIFRPAVAGQAVVEGWRPQHRLSAVRRADRSHLESACQYAAEPQREFLHRQRPERRRSTHRLRRSVVRPEQMAGRHCRNSKRRRWRTCRRCGRWLRKWYR